MHIVFRYILSDTFYLPYQLLFTSWRFIKYIIVNNTSYLAQFVQQTITNYNAFSSNHDHTKIKFSNCLSLKPSFFTLYTGYVCVIIMYMYIYCFYHGYYEFINKIPIFYFLMLILFYVHKIVFHSEM